MSIQSEITRLSDARAALDAAIAAKGVQDTRRHVRHQDDYHQRGEQAAG